MKLKITNEKIRIKKSETFKMPRFFLILPPSFALMKHYALAVFTSLFAEERYLVIYTKFDKFSNLHVCFACGL